MHDIRAIREAPEEFDRELARRRLPARAAGLIAIDERRRALLTELQSLQARRNEASRQIGQVKRKGGDAQPLMDEVSAIKDDMARLEDDERSAAQDLNDALAGIPNLALATVPVAVAPPSPRRRPIFQAKFLANFAPAHTGGHHGHGLFKRDAVIRIGDSLGMDNRPPAKA